VRPRPCAEFQADFPDDQIEDETGIVQFGGRGVAEAIVLMLRGLEYETSAPEDQQEHGWDFNVRSRDGRVWLQISDLGDGFILQSAFYPRFSLSGKPWLAYADLLTRLNAEVAKDSRFHDVKWQWEKDLLSGAPGAKEPAAE